MHTDSSASFTYLASVSASEYTTTVRMPISRQARWERSAISPRVAIRIFSNMLGEKEKRLSVLHRLGGDPRLLDEVDQLFQLAQIHSFLPSGWRLSPQNLRQPSSPFPSICQILSIFRRRRLHFSATSFREPPPPPLG